MSKTIGNIKSVISSRLHGTSLNKIGDFNLLCKDTAEIILNRIDLQENIRQTTIPNAVYDQVYDYALPADFKAPVSLNTQANNIDNSNLARTYSKQFNNQKKNNQFAIVWRDMVQFLRFARYLRTPIILDKADSITENGTWSVGGNGSNILLDTYDFISGIGALKCDISSPGAVVSVQMLIGNDSSNYYSKTITAGHFDAFTTGWNLLRFNLSDATPTGSVNMATIKYLKFLVTYNTNQTAYFEKTLTTHVDMSVDNYKTSGAVFAYMNFGTKDSLTVLKLDNITAHIGTLYDINYYSNYLFRTSAGVWIEEPTSDTDLINLSPLSYKIFEAELSKMITQQIQGSIGGFDFAYWNLQLEGNDNQEGLYDQYARQYPSEREEGQSNYYNFSDDEFENDDYEGYGFTPNE